MSALQQPPELNDAVLSLRFARMQVEDLNEVQEIEDAVYPYPWTRGNFLDSLYSGYETCVVRDDNAALAGYFLLMHAVDEAHLLNITVHGAMHGRGIGRVLLCKVRELTQERKMTSVLLEVRPSNRRALSIYQQFGFCQIGMRKGYYPAPNNTREDAIVMRLPV